MNEKDFKINDFMWTAFRSIMVGLGVYLIITAIFVLLLWFTSVPEWIMTYGGAGCLSLGCFAAGLKMGSGTGRKGILMGAAAACVLSVIVWGAAVVLSQGNVFESSCVIKAAIYGAAGILGGMIGVNTAR